MGMSALHRAFCSGCASVFAAAPILAQAPTPDPDPLRAMQRELDAARAELAELRAALDTPAVVSGSLGVTLTNQYLFRAILQENQGVVAQPWAELGFHLHQGRGDDLLQSVDLTAGIWNSLHDGPTGGAGGVWYEADVYAGLSARLGSRWTVGATYTVYHSPNGSFGTVEEVSGSLAFDDSDLWLPFALQPSAIFAFEVDGQADAGTKEGIYAQLGVEPHFPLGGVNGFGFELVVPLVVGLSVRDYYELPTGGGDKAFGYFDAGLVLAASLTDLPNPGNPWTVEAGLHYLVLGDTNEARNAGESSELLATFTVGTSF